MTPGIYNYPSQVRGDTIRQRTFTVSIDTIPANIVSAKMNIRDCFNVLVYNVPLVVNSNIITQPSIDGSVTKLFPLAILNYDIEITLSGGLIRTYIQGTIEILKDYSYE